MKNVYNLVCRLYLAIRILFPERHAAYCYTACKLAPQIKFICVLWHNILSLNFLILVNLLFKLSSA